MKCSNCGYEGGMIGVIPSIRDPKCPECGATSEYELEEEYG